MGASGSSSCADGSAEVASGLSLGDPAGQREVSQRSQLIESVGMAPHRFDPSFDFSYARQCEQGRRFGRGSPFVEYFPPCGFDSLGLSMSNLGDGAGTFTDQASGWHVAYHGTDPQNLPRILDEGLKARGGQARPRHGDLHGNAIYLSPYPEVARTYAGHIHIDRKIAGVMLQCRVRPGSYTAEDDGRIWLVRDPSDVRCHSLLFLREFVLFSRKTSKKGD